MQTTFRLGANSGYFDLKVAVADLKDGDIVIFIVLEYPGLQLGMKLLMIVGDLFGV